MPLTDAQRIIVENSKRFTVACCGRRFGKTTIAIRQICYEARMPGKEIYYVSPSYRMSKTIVFRKLKEKLLSLKWIRKINETEMTFTLVNGSTISLKGADNFDSLRGIGLDYLVCDEAADIDPEAFYSVLRPALSDKQGKALFLGTPKGFNWFKDIFDLAEQYPEEWASFQFTTLDGGQVPVEEIESAKRDLDEKTFAQEYLGTFQNFSGRVYYAFNREQNIKNFQGQIPDILHIGIDFNLDPICAVVAVKEANTLWIIDEIKMMGSNTDELVEEIRNRYPTQTIICYPDPAGAARSTKSGGKTDHTILRMAGFQVKAPHAHRPVRDGINAVNSKLCNSNGISSLFIHQRCKYTTECLEKHTYKEGTSIPNKTDGYEHILDALRYLTDWLFPITQTAPRPPVATWGHKISNRR